MLDFSKLLPSDIIAESYDGSRIDVMGYLDVNLRFKTRCTLIKLYIAVKGVNVLGWKDQGRLGIILNPRAREPVIIDESLEEYKVSTVSPDEKENFIKVKFKDVFSDVLGKLKDFSHKIKLKNGVIPVKHKLRGVPINVREELMGKLDELVAEKIIEPVDSAEWISPIVLVRKPDKILRVCVDLRALNANIIVDCHPLPNINEVVSMLEGARVFSTLDLRSAYHQIPLTEDSKSLTAFITPQGLYQYTRMPFGLASAASVFQRIMFNVFRDADKYVKCFQDNILIFSINVEEHVKHLIEVCERLRKKWSNFEGHQM